MRLNSAKRCRHCVNGACMGACARHLSHKIWYLSHVVNASYNPAKLDI